MVDISKIESEDEVEVLVPQWGTAGGTRSPLNDKGEVYVVGAWGGWFFKPEHVVSHTPKPREIKVGDLVTWGAGITDWIFLAEDEGSAWVKRDGRCATVKIKKLRHAKP